MPQQSVPEALAAKGSWLPKPQAANTIHRPPQRAAGRVPRPEQIAPVLLLKVVNPVHPQRLAPVLLKPALQVLPRRLVPELLKPAAPLRQIVPVAHSRTSRSNLNPVSSSRK